MRGGIARSKRFPPRREGSTKFLNLCPATDCSKRAVFGWSLPHERGKFHFTRDQIAGLKFSFAGQCPRVAPYVAEHKFHRTREGDRITFASSPLCLPRSRGAPDFRSWIEQHQRAFSVALRIKAHRAVLCIRKSYLHVPLASHVRSLCLNQGAATHLCD